VTTRVLTHDFVVCVVCVCGGVLCCVVGNDVADDTFFQSAEIRLLQPADADDAEGVKVGSIGVLHPLVLKAFKIENPVSAFEVSLEPFL